MFNGHALAPDSPARPAALRALRQWLTDAGAPCPEDDDTLAVFGYLTYTMTVVDREHTSLDSLTDDPDFTLLFDPNTPTRFLFGPL